MKPDTEFHLVVKLNMHNIMSLSCYIEILATC